MGLVCLAVSPAYAILDKDKTVVRENTEYITYQHEDATFETVNINSRMPSNQGKVMINQFIREKNMNKNQAIDFLEILIESSRTEKHMEFYLETDVLKGYYSYDFDWLWLGSLPVGFEFTITGDISEGMESIYDQETTLEVLLNDVLGFDDYLVGLYGENHRIVRFYNWILDRFHNNFIIRGPNYFADLIFSETLENGCRVTSAPQIGVVSLRLGVDSPISGPSFGYGLSISPLYDRNPD